MSASLPPDARRSLLVYNLLFPFALLFLLPGLLSRMFKRGNFQEKFSQRLGRFDSAARERFQQGRWIWIHSISVGETLLALKLARRMLELDPAISIALSVTTSTGFAVATRGKHERLEPIYNPLDFPPIVRRTLNVLHPERLVFIEAIWPNLLAICKQRGLPVGFIPRMSPRSERRFRRFRAWTGPLFRLIDTLAVGDDNDIARWLPLDVRREQCQITGNIKYDQEATAPANLEPLRAFLDEFGVGPDRPILLAGSTFPGEETIIANAMVKIRDKHPTLFAIIAPRHVERTPEIVRELESSPLRVALRTEPAKSPCDLLLLNTTGELRDWYHLCTLVFIGKSLTGRGGQNPVEPVLAGKPVLFGPHMQNFEPLASRWVESGAALRVHDANELISRCHDLLSDARLRDVMAERARRSIELHHGATTRTARALLGMGEASKATAL
ncbi:MAG: glycosyltransferase N-terminal domain-containing protein [Chthoniobacteraceae bacterium]